MTIPLAILLFIIEELQTRLSVSAKYECIEVRVKEKHVITYNRLTKVTEGCT